MRRLPFPNNAVYLTVNECAELFRVTPKTVRRWITSGRLNATRIGREWRVPRENLKYFAQVEDRGGPSNVL